jgi:Domain of unknown function (DUF4124)
MHLWRQWMALTALAALAIFTASATTVYRWTDADGVVHFSDQPAPGAEKVPIGPVKLYGTPTTSGPSQAQKKQGSATKPAHLGYTSVVVTSPAAEKTFFDEPVPVVLTVAPGLKDGDIVTWYLNGAAQDEKSASFTIARLDRGAYSLYATITDASTQELITSDAVTFYVREPSVLSPQYPKK